MPVSFYHLLGGDIVGVSCGEVDQGHALHRLQDGGLVQQVHKVWRMQERPGLSKDCVLCLLQQHQHQEWKLAQEKKVSEMQETKGE